MINRARLFAALRRSRIFDGQISQSAVDNIEVVLAEYDRRRIAAQNSDRKTGWPLTWLAYQLATIRGECGPDMAPVREIGRGRGKRYCRPTANGQTYYGRGYVQLTWEENYASAGRKLALPLVSDPDLVMQPPIAVRILFDGMRDGWFAGDKRGRHALSRYFNDGVTDWSGARRIINGTDKAATFAAWAQQFHIALLRALDSTAEEPISPPPPAKPVTRSTTIGAAGTAGAIEALNQIERATKPVAETAERAGGIVETFRPVLDLWAMVPPWLKLVLVLGMIVWIIRERLKAREEYGR